MSTNLGRNSESEKKEFFDSAQKLQEHVTKLAQWINESNHCIVFTGAGISTSTGIPDFRSGTDTVLETGPGAWELRDTGKQRSKKARVKSTLQAIPSPTHMALVELQRIGKVKFIVSQNCDGLHLRSGLHPESLSELHGNTNLEKCEKCQRSYLRDFGTRNARDVYEHSTGRFCDDSKCGGKLHDSIINFGEHLPDKELRNAYSNAKKADLCICLGSSLTVSPANDIPATVATRGQKLVIVNLQKTPLHDTASLPIHGMCDDVMRSLMHQLNIPIPSWQLKRRVSYSIVTSCLPNGKLSVIAQIESRHPDCDLPYLIFKSVTMTMMEKTNMQQTVTKQPFDFKIIVDRQSLPAKFVRLNFKLNFFGHYDEPPFDLLADVPVNDASTSCERLLFYCPFKRRWTVNQ